MTPLYVAAGGGGDALAALIVRRALGDGSPAIVASYSWDRYVLDPAPGPRTAADFTGLTQHSASAWEVVSGTSLRSGAASTLTLGASATDARWFLLDPAAGAKGMTAQLSEILTATGTDSVILVDVGGDVIAQGDEPELRSPLADSLTLAAVAALDQESRVVITGPGLDGELPAELVRRRCIEAHGQPIRLTAEHTGPYLDALQRHPSEATALLAAAITGVRGQAEIRDGGILLTLDSHSADTYVIPTGAVLAVNQLAQALAGTSSLDEAEHLAHDICGRSELAYERRKAHEADAARPGQLDDSDLSARIDRFLADANKRGADLATYRRITDAIGSRTYEPERLRALLRERSLDHLAVATLA